MNNLVIIGARSVLGLIFLVFGLNGFLQFMEMPPLQGAAAAFMGGLAQTGYFFPFLKGAEVICGALLLANLYAPLSVVILAPIVLNILLFHLYLVPDGMPMTILIVLLQLVLIVAYKDSYRGLFQSKP